jgi:aldose sugar dehydrogenase
MAVAMLKGQGLKLLFLDSANQVARTSSIAEVGPYGRIRTVQYGPDGALYFTSSNGAGKDVVGRISP